MPESTTVGWGHDPSVTEPPCGEWRWWQSSESRRRCSWADIWPAGRGSTGPRSKFSSLVPKSVRNPNGLQSSSDSVIAAAGVVAIKVGSSTPVSAVSDNVSLVGEGIRSGYRVRLPNSGGQWANNFDQSLLDVQAAGATPAEVSATMQNVLDRINSTLQSMQSDAGSARANDIELALSPPTWPMYYQSGSRARTVLATMLLGIGLPAC